MFILKQGQSGPLELTLKLQKRIRLIERIIVMIVKRIYMIFFM